ncbi:uncharacterized protein [Eschrichtius robustus]|uniref:uncharacterized protein n=1 Tax=Eschrichtius robustus TaxID=9764 RepID=UPI0035C14CE6
MPEKVRLHSSALVPSGSTTGPISLSGLSPRPHSRSEAIPGRDSLVEPPVTTAHGLVPPTTVITRRPRQLPISHASTDHQAPGVTMDAPGAPPRSPRTVHVVNSGEGTCVWSTHKRFAKETNRRGNAGLSPVDSHRPAWESHLPSPLTASRGSRNKCPLWRNYGDGNGTHWITKVAGTQHRRPTGRGVAFPWEGRRGGRSRPPNASSFRHPAVPTAERIIFGN